MTLLDFSMNLLCVSGVTVLASAFVVLMWRTGAKQEKIAEKAKRLNVDFRAGRLSPFDGNVPRWFIIGVRLNGCWFKFGAVFIGLLSLAALAELVVKIFFN